MNRTCIPLAHLSKKPMRESFTLASSDPAVHAEWIDRRWNLGLLLLGLVVIDIDAGKDFAREFWKKHVKENLWNVAVETYRGIHLIFTGETQSGKLVIDGQTVGDKKAGKNSYVVTPPSQVLQENGTLWEYRYIRGYEWKDPLPFPGYLFPEVERTRTITRKKIRSLDAYLATVESKQGSNGSAGLVRAAAVCRDAGLSESEATVKLLWWTTLPVVCPPWSAQEIARAVTRAYRKQTA